MRLIRLLPVSEDGIVSYFNTSFGSLGSGENFDVDIFVFLRHK